MSYILNQSAFLFVPLVMNIFLYINISQSTCFDGRAKKTSLFLIAMIPVNVIIICCYHCYVGEIKFNLWQIVPGLSISFATQNMGIIFALILSILWLIAYVYTDIYLTSTQINKISLYFALSLSAALCVAFAANLLTLFIFYEILTITTYPMIKCDLNVDSKKAAKKYLLMLLGSSFLFFLPAMVINYYYIGNLDFQIEKNFNFNTHIAFLLLFLYVFGAAKTAIMPLHSWLTGAMVAPIPISALLHSVAVVKVGVFTLLKIITFNIRLNNIHYYGSLFLSIISIVTIVTSVFMAKKQTNLKLLLAYSTISQLSYSILISAMINKNAMDAAFFQMICHAFAKIALFFAAGYFYLAANIREIKDLSGMGKKMPLVTACFSICALSLIGIAPFAGFWSKFYILKAVYPLNIISYMIIVTIIISSLVTASYFLPIIYQLWWGEDVRYLVNSEKLCKNHIGSPSRLDSKFPLIIVTIVVIFLGFFYEFFMNLNH